jgi:hypothetical protein
MKHFYLLYISIFIFFTSCEIINPAEDIPTNITINSFDFTAEAGQGSSLANINDSWIYVNGELIGAFEIPATVPVLKSGNQIIEIAPGVILNGIGGTRSRNPFFTTYSITKELIPNETISIQPKSEYVKSTIFPWNARGTEDFEEGGISIDSVPGSASKIIKSNEDVFEGSYSGKIHLSSQYKNYMGQSKKVFQLPKSGSYVVMEMNIKNPTTPLSIGMYVNLTSGQVKEVHHLTINTGPNWKKIYVNFTELVSYYTDATGYRVFFKADLGTSNESTIFLDNIKIMHF